MERPIIALTMGDAAGVGPEIIAKALADEAIGACCRPLVIADAAVMRAAAGLLDSRQEARTIPTLAEAEFDARVINVLTPPGLDVGEVAPGQLTPRLGEAAAACMRQAFALAAQGPVAGVVLGPINKQGFHLAGYRYVDELAYLAELTACPDAFPLGAITPTFWTVAVTQHLPFRDIVAEITAQRIVWYARRLYDVLRATGIATPRLAVAALNVHGGEGGLFGREELDVIGPAIAAARGEGLPVEGPLPADTVFVRARAGEFQGVVCMYHDQANIARKLLATRRGATVFSGLPVPCATTAHGTAYDIAGKGVAAPESLIDALRVTSSLAGTA